MTDNPVERVARAMSADRSLRHYGLRDDSWAAETDYGREEWLCSARAAIAALNTPQPGPNDALVEALEPFAACVDQISPDEDDEEWAKFRLLVKDYRRAANALWPNRNGFARCPTCKGEFDEGEWNASTCCPECEEPKVSALSTIQGQSPSPPDTK